VLRGDFKTVGQLQRDVARRIDALSYKPALQGPVAMLLAINYVLRFTIRQTPMNVSGALATGILR
jgi:hypothetical protein